MCDKVVLEILQILEGKVALGVFFELRPHNPAFHCAFAADFPHELVALSSVFAQFQHVAQNGQGRFVSCCSKRAQC